MEVWSKPGSIGDPLLAALGGARLYSNEPVCAEHDPGAEHDPLRLHGAACRSCLPVADLLVVKRAANSGMTGWIWRWSCQRSSYPMRPFSHDWWPMLVARFLTGICAGTGRAIVCGRDNAAAATLRMVSGYAKDHRTAQMFHIELDTGRFGRYQARDVAAFSGGHWRV